jgi:predicted RNase H-like nuclease
VVAEGRADGRGRPRVSRLESFDEMIRRVRADEVAVVAIDIPIGLAEHGARACDIEARARLGPRRSSVFPAPVRAVLGAATWTDANATARAVDGRGLPRQVFNLLAKIAEVDARISPALQSRIVEAHPELCFASMSGAPLAFAKRTPAGQHDRMALVRAPILPVAGAARDDVLDAHALLWTARRVARGVEARLGDGSRDRRGLRMEIVY